MNIGTFVVLSLMFVLIAMMNYLGVWGWIEDGKWGRIFGSFIILISYALYIGLCWCCISGGLM